MASVASCEASLLPVARLIHRGKPKSCRRLSVKPCALKSSQISLRTSDTGRSIHKNELSKYRRDIVRANAARTDNVKTGTTAPPVEEKKAVVVKRARWSTPTWLRLPRNWGAASFAVIGAIGAVQTADAFLQIVNAVPFFQEAEILIGTVFSLNIAKDFFGGGAGRARLESLFEDLADRVQGIKGLDAASLEEEPSMLDVQVRSQVDRHLSLRGDLALVADRAALVAALSDFVATRELKSRRVNAVLRSDLAEAKTCSRDLRLKLSESANSTMEQKMEVEKLVGFNATLQKEKEAMLSQVEAVTSRLNAIGSELQAMAQERDSLKELNRQLEVCALKAETSAAALNSRLLHMEQRNAVQALATEAAEMRRVEELLLLRREREGEGEQREALIRTLETALAVAEQETKVRRERERALEAQLKRAEDSVGERDVQIRLMTEERGELKMKQAEIEGALESLHKELSASKRREGAVERSAQTKMEVAVAAEQRRHVARADWLEQELAVAQLEREAAAHRVKALEEAKALSVKAVKKEVAARHVARSPLPLKAAEQISSIEKELNVETPGKLLNEHLSKELQAYARSVRSQYVDIAKPAKEQEKEVQAFVKDLLSRGASEAAAQKYVRDSMARERRKLNKNKP